MDLFTILDAAALGPVLLWPSSEPLSFDDLDFVSRCSLHGKDEPSVHEAQLASFLSGCHEGLQSRRARWSGGTVVIKATPRDQGVLVTYECFYRRPAARPWWRRWC